MDEEIALKILPYLKMLKMYHRHDIFGMENIPKTGAGIVLTNHSLATYDIMLLFASIYQCKGRFPRSLIDRLFYKVPGMGTIMEKFGCVVGDSCNARALLSNGELIQVAPGGMSESLIPSKRKYTIDWNERLGFAKLAIESGSPVILAACPNADDIFEVYDTKITKWAYSKFKVPIFCARGLGLTGIPRPVKLSHFISKPIYPPKKSSDAKKMLLQVTQFHRLVLKKMEKSMNNCGQQSLSFLP